MDLPKVNILTAGTFSVAILSAAGGSIWYASNQASIIEALQSEVEILNIQNTQADKTNLIRDVQRNTDHLQEVIDILSEVYEEIEDGDNEIWEDIDMINEDMGGMASHMMEIIKLQSRITILEKTVEFSRNDGM